MEITGKIIQVCEPKSGIGKASGKAWMTQEYVLETIESYPQKCILNAFGEERIKEYNIKAGETVTIVFNFNGREYNGRWFNSLDIVSVKRNNEPHSSVETNTKVNSVPQDDLPF